MAINHPASYLGNKKSSCFTLADYDTNLVVSCWISVRIQCELYLVIYQLIPNWRQLAPSYFNVMVPTSDFHFLQEALVGHFSSQLDISIYQATSYFDFEDLYTPL
jgi:hypothetical protein